MQSDESSELFRGVVDVDLTIVKPTPKDPNNNTEQTSSHPIMVELAGHMVGGSQIQNQNGDNQVPNTSIEIDVGPKHLNQNTQTLNNKHRASG